MDIKVYILMAAGIILQGLFIKAEHEEKFVLADVLKGTASLMFVLIGIIAYNYGRNEPRFLGLILAGLVAGMIGDILLNLRFVFPAKGQLIFLMGIAAFLAGHILYLIALIPYTPHLLPSIIVGALLAALLLSYIFKTMEVKKAFKIFGVIYLGAIIIMTCMAIDCALYHPYTNGLERAAPVSAIIYAIGAVLFTASDIVLIFNTFSGVTKFSLRITNLTLYYLGQLFIAASLFILRI